MPAEKIFVTGATGFIGERLVRRLVEKQCCVRALSRRDRLPSPPGLDANGGGPRHRGAVELVRGDIADLDSLQALVAGVGK